MREVGEINITLDVYGQSYELLADYCEEDDSVVYLNWRTIYIADENCWVADRRDHIISRMLAINKVSEELIKSLSLAYRAHAAEVVAYNRIKRANPNWIGVLHPAGKHVYANGPDGLFLDTTPGKEKVIFLENKSGSQSIDKIHGYDTLRGKNQWRDHALTSIENADFTPAQKNKFIAIVNNINDPRNIRVTTNVLGKVSGKNIKILKIDDLCNYQGKDKVLIKIGKVTDSEIKKGLQAVSHWHAKAYVANNVAKIPLKNRALRIAKKAAKPLAIAFIIQVGVTAYDGAVAQGKTEEQALKIAENAMAQAVVDEVFCLDIQEPFWNGLWNHYNTQFQPWVSRHEWANHYDDIHGGEGPICTCFGIEINMDSIVYGSEY